MLANHLKIGKIPSSEQIAQAFKKIDTFKKDRKNEDLKYILSYVTNNIDRVYGIQLNEGDNTCQLLFQTHTTPGFLYSVTVEYFPNAYYGSNHQYFLNIDHAEFINKDLDMNFIEDVYVYIEDINEDLVRFNKLLKENNKVSFYLASNCSFLSLDPERSFDSASVKRANEYYDEYFKHKREKQQALDRFNTNIKKYLNELIKDRDSIYSIAYKLTTSYKDYIITTTIDIKNSSKLLKNKSEFQKKNNEISERITEMVISSGITKLSNMHVLFNDEKYADQYDLYLDVSTEKYFDKIMYSY